MLRLVIIVLVIYLAFRFIIKPLIKYYIQQAIKKAVEREANRPGGSSYPPRKEGTIQVDYVPDQEKPKPPSGNKDGEYIDYEEIK